MVEGTMLQGFGEHCVKSNKSRGIRTGVDRRPRRYGFHIKITSKVIDNQTKKPASTLSLMRL
ncbi:MAG: hypothetical protein AAFY59_11565, partial [Pseudomonadota bacterium]